MADSDVVLLEDSKKDEETNGVIDLAQEDIDPVQEAILLENEDTEKKEEESKDVEMEEKKEDEEKKEEEEKPTPIEQLARGTVKISPLVINDLKIKDFIILLHKAENFMIEFEKKEGAITLNFAPEKTWVAWQIVRTIAHMKLTNKELKVECPQAFAEVIANEKEGKNKKKKQQSEKQKKADETNAKLVKVSNIPTETTEEALKGLFADADKITIEKDDEGKSKGTAILEFKSAEDATKFLEENKDKEVKIEENALTFSKPEKDPFDELKKRWERWSGSGESKKKKKKKAAEAAKQQAASKAKQSLQKAKQHRVNTIRQRQGMFGGRNRGGMMGPMGPRPNMGGQEPYLMNQMEMLANMMNMSGGFGGGGMMNQMGGGGMMNQMGGGGGGMMNQMGEGGGMMQGRRGEMMQGMQGRGGEMMQGMQGRGGRMMQGRGGMRGQGNQQMMQQSMGNFGFQEEEMGMRNPMRRNSGGGMYDNNSNMYRSGYNNRGGFEEEEEDFMPQNMYGFQNSPGKRKSIWDDDNQGRQGNQWGGKKQRGGGGGGFAGKGRGGGGDFGGGRGGGRGGGMGKQGPGKRQRNQQSDSNWMSSEDMWSDFMSNQGQSGNYGGYPY